MNGRIRESQVVKREPKGQNFFTAEGTEDTEKYQTLFCVEPKPSGCHSEKSRSDTEVENPPTGGNLRLNSISLGLNSTPRFLPSASLGARRRPYGPQNDRLLMSPRPSGLGRDEVVDPPTGGGLGFYGRQDTARSQAKSIFTAYVNVYTSYQSTREAI